MEKQLITIKADEANGTKWFTIITTNSHTSFQTSGYNTRIEMTIFDNNLTADDYFSMAESLILAGNKKREVN